MKRKHVFLAGLLACFFVFMFTGCPSQVNPSSVTITFKIGNETRTVDVLYGEKYWGYQSTSDAYNTFLYWSKSNDSIAAAEAGKVDLNTATFTEDVTLYAIYAPDLYTSTYYDSIQELTATQITFKLKGKAVYPLVDGSYAGITFEHSTDNYNYEPFTISEIPTYIDDTNFRYLTYTFNSRLSEGTHWIKVISKNASDKKEVKCKNLTNPKTVTFYDNDTFVTSVEVESGDTLASLTTDEMPPNPSRSYNYFMYWSDSKASQAKAIEFDKTKPITKDTTLYAIYTPKLVSITDVSATTLKLQLFDPLVYPLDDGSYAGVKFTHSLDNVNYEDFDLSVPVSYEDTSYYRYLLYEFETPLSEGTHSFKVTNGHEISSKSITITSPKPVSDLNATVADSYVNVSFSPVTGYSSYTVKLYLNGSELTSKSVYASTTANVEFFGLENGTEYTVEVITGSSDQSATKTVTPQITKKESDWVVAMYMDGDNNLHHPIFIDMNEAEYGLYQIRDSNGTPNSSYDSVNVVALWDGAVSWEDEDDNGDPITVTPQIGETGSYIFELGSDSGCTTTYTTSTGCVLSSNTKNLSYTAPWLVGSNKQVSTTQPTSCGEVNMGNKQTLINFLNWVNDHYTANKGVILQFSDHGGGPRNQMYLETADGKTLTLSDDRRALCWDESSSSDFLKTKDVSDALATVGYGASNKLSMILMDVCLGSSFEDAYQFKNYAEYLAASPNNIPGNGLNYVALMKSFKKDTTIDAIGKQIVEDYKAQYGGQSDRWNYYTQNASEYNYYSSLNDSQKYSLEWQGHLGMTTFTITDLNEVDNVKTTIDSLCDVLLSTEGRAKKVKLASNGFISLTDTSNEADYVKYLMRYTNAEKLFVTNNTSTQYYIDDSIYYMGSYVWLYDIGYIADMMKYCSATSINGTTNVNAWSELYTAADNVITALGQAVKYSWRDSMLNDSNDFYSLIEGSSTNASTYNHYYGLTIGGAGFATVSKKIVQGKLPDWYMTDLEFGKESKWSELLSYWFGVQE
ncbi:clostripain-related cysteine peptidase [Treponema bryantii]|uniref:clostripain-related cysteine peptidase n=1 Tax=Treponema bryantii TaxID=163 RepID=UPI002B2A697C|nr:hypothetical protein TRBR_24790 [Treponema bryantii]